MEHLSKQLDGNKWECSVACRKVSDNDAQAMIELIESFNMPIEELREDLELVDSGCPYMHHVRLQNNECDMSHAEVSKLGHPHPCNSGACKSKLHILRAASSVKAST